MNDSPRQTPFSASPPTTLPEETPRRTRRVIVRRASAEEEAAPRQHSGGWGCTRVVIALALIAAALIAVLILSTQITLGGLASGLTTLLAPGPAQITVVPSQTIVNSIQPMGQLVSISVQLAKADIEVSISQGLLGASSFSTSHVAQGTIEAGIDLTRLSVSDVVYDAASGTYTVTLPPAQLTGCHVDYIRQYAYSGTILPVDRDQARQLAEYTAVIEFRDDALESGILGRAEEQARLVFANLVSALTGSKTEIVFNRAVQLPLPPSCEPDPPGNWSYDPATQTWTQPE